MSNAKSDKYLFPRVGYTEGITLRDYIAIQAMQAILPICDFNELTNLGFIASTAFKMADEMLQEKDK